MDSSIIRRLARRVCAAVREAPPSERDRQVFEQVRLQGRRQADVAAELGISQGRVSQICRSVAKWCVQQVSPASQGPQQFRELADLACELAHLRQLAEERGEVRQSGGRVEVFLHAVRSIAASDAHINRASSSSSCRPGAPLASETGSSADDAAVYLPSTCDEPAGNERR